MARETPAWKRKGCPTFVALVCLLATSAAGAQQKTGLDWDGTAPSRRSLQWTSSLPPPYPFTAMFKVYPRSIPVANDRFSAHWFRGNSGIFQFGSGYCSGYYGWTEYPVPNRSSESKTEVSAGQGYGSCTDRVTRDNSSDPSNDKAADAPYTTYGQWYSRAITARFTGSVYEHKGYYSIGAGVGTSLTVTSQRFSAWTRPPSDSIFMGQTGDNGSGKSWGGEARWEESNAIFRGLQFYDALLTPTQLQNRSSCDTDACVLAQCAGDPPCPWFLNMNPTPTDVSDKSGRAHHATWVGPGRPRLWSDGSAAAPAAPVISAVSAANVSTSGATINWTTDKASDSQVEYGATASYGQATSVAAALVTSHSMTLSSLATGVTYHYRVRSKDSSGNAGLSGDYTFTTGSGADTVAPVISAVSATNIAATSATIQWTTNEPADSQVEFGTTASYGQITPLNTTRVTGHSVNLTALVSGTTYHYRVRSRDAAGNLAVSGDSTFTPASGSATALRVAFGFTEAAGTTTVDGSGNGFNGTLVNGPVWTSGHGGSAILFDGVNDKVTLPSTLDVPTLPFTLEAWIRPTSRADWRAIFSKRAAFSAAGMRVDLGLQPTSGRVYVTTYRSMLYFTYAPALNAWTHVAIVADSSGTKLYINGTLQQTLAALLLGTGSTAPVAIGSTGDNHDPFAGTIDDVRLYNRVLTQGEIQSDMNISVP